MRDAPYISLENKKRNSLLDEPYDPFIGINSPIKRVPVLTPSGVVNIPADMVHGYFTSVLLRLGSFEETAKHFNVNEIQAFELFCRERYIYDFEFWCASCIKILHKDTFRYVPFILRKAQRKLLKALEEMRVAGVPIRIVLLKARQWGGSTLVQIYMMWIQQIHRKNWHLAVCAQDDNAAKNVAGMYDTASKEYPEDVGTISFRPFKKSSKNILNIERGGIIGVGSINNPNQFRSYNYAMIHFTEAAYFGDTEKRSASALVSSLKETVPDQPYTVVIEESTAKGMNYFHDSWNKAVKGETRYRAVFVAWHEIDRCRVALDVPVEIFLKSMSDYEWYLWELGATLEGINWYRKHKADKGYQDWEMQAENPSEPDEAFQSTGQKVFNPIYIRSCRKDCCDPIFRGDVVGKTRAGEFALTDLRLEPMAHGRLKVWKTPEEVKMQKIKNRICGFADIGGTSSKADYSTLGLIDREPMIYGNDPELIAAWHGHLEQDLFAWKMAQLCMIYSQPEIAEYPLLAFEIQSLKKKLEEGNHSLTILDSIKDYYPNLFIRNDEEKVGDEFIPRYGFHTNVKTKGMIIDTLKSALRERYLRDTEEQEQWGYIERDSEALDEMSWYEAKDNGELGAIQGKKDDRVIRTAGGLWLALRYMDKPYAIKEYVAPRKPKIRNYSSY